MERESIDIFYMKMAYLISERSTCIRRKVGSVIVRDKLIISSGYNGACTNLEHCTRETCLRKNIPSGENLLQCRSAHSECNAIAQAAKKGVSIDNSTIYCTTFPCSYCAKLIVNSGIKHLFYCEGYGDGINELTREILQNVEIIQINKEDILK